MLFVHFILLYCGAIVDYAFAYDTYVGLSGITVVARESLCVSLRAKKGVFVCDF